MAFSLSNVVGIFLFGLLIASATVSAAGSHPAPAPAADCSSLILSLVDCLSFVSSGSTEKKPAGTCCDGLKQVLKTDAECLCEAFKNSAQLGVTLNDTKALSLPAACRISAPSVANCALSTGSPAMSPALTPGGSVVAPTPSGGAASSDASAPPAAAPGTSGSSMVSASSGMMVAIAIACLALF